MSDLVPMGLIRDRLGDMDVRSKLAVAASAPGLFLLGPVVVSGDLPDPAHSIQTPAMLADLRRAGLVPPATVVPGADSVLPPLIAGQTPVLGRAERLGAQLRALRWERTQPSDYVGILTSWLVSTAVEQGEHGGWWARQAADLWRQPTGEKTA